MIVRNLVKCHACSDTLWLRIDRPELKKDSYLYACPTCSAEILITAKQTSIGISIESDDCDIVDIDDYQYQQYPTGVMTLSSHYPVFIDVQHKDLTEGGSPKLYYFSKDFFGSQKYMEIISFFAAIKEHIYGEHCRILDALDSCNLDLVRNILANSKFSSNSDILQTSDTQITYEVYSYLSVIFFTSLQFDYKCDLYEEYYKELNNCMKTHMSKYIPLLHDFSTNYDYLKNRSKLFNIHKRLFRQVESYSAGFIYEYASDDFKAQISKCRLYRPDFDTVKSLYVDIFELMSKTTVYMVLIINLSKRGNCNHFIEDSMTISKFMKLPSFKKLQFLNELPKIGALFHSVSRQMRNEIGHFSARYDVKNGYVIFDSGETKNYLVFLNELLQAIKALKIVYTVYSKIDLDIVQCKA